MSDKDDMEEFETILLTDEDGQEVEFAVIDAAEMDGVNYLLVVEADWIEDENAEAMILKEVGSDEENIDYELVEDDEELEKVAALFENGEGYDVILDE
ncbi:MAG TPA: DUF1292 domain-containing protein [Firmicutes bacterium]|nr:DUF1292 domain-containing protein [Bacillota bacterium]